MTQCPIDWPVIVKPAMQDASVGLDQGSVVTDQERLNERVAYLLDAYGPPVLVEEFIRGREFNVGLIESPDLRVLPVSEILFVDQEPGYWPIVTYDAKWKPGSRDYEATPAKYPAEVSPRLAERLHAAGRAGVSAAGLPRLRPRRFPRPAQRQAVHPGGEPEPRLQPHGRPGRRTDVRRPDARPVHGRVGPRRPGAAGPGRPKPVGV